MITVCYIKFSGTPAMDYTRQIKAKVRLTTLDNIDITGLKLYKSSNSIYRTVQIFLPYRIAILSLQLKKRFEKFLVNAADDDKVYQYLMSIMSV